MTIDLFQMVPRDILEQVQNIRLDFPGQECKKEIYALLERTVLLNGKRLRPLLTYLVGNFFGQKLDVLRPYAESIELVHAASLAHDDVIDGATTRRGLPSINQEGNKRAVLAGDYLLANVMANLAREGRPKLVEEMGEVVASLAWGEWLQLSVSQSRRYDRHVLEEIALCKTASVMGWCIIAPAYLAQVPDQVMEYCRELGQCLGVAFQSVDDILDFSSESTKGRQLDLENGIVNSVLFEYLEANKNLKQRFLQGEKLSQIMEEESSLKEAIDKVRLSAQKKLARCRELFNVILKETPVEGEKEEEFVRRKKALYPLDMMLDYMAERSV